MLCSLKAFFLIRTIHHSIMFVLFILYYMILYFICLYQVYNCCTHKSIVLIKLMWFSIRMYECSIFFRKLFMLWSIILYVLRRKYFSPFCCISMRSYLLIIWFFYLNWRKYDLILFHQHEEGTLQHRNNELYYIYLQQDRNHFSNVSHAVFNYYIFIMEMHFESDINIDYKIYTPQ